MRGLFTAILLERVERDSGSRIKDHFDLITGTSTGGIIALGLSLGLEMSDLVRFYREEGPKIFPPSTAPKWWQRRRPEWTRHLFHPKYSNDKLKRALQNKDVFGERTLAEYEVPLVVPAFNLEKNVSRLFKTRHHEDYRRDHKLPAWKVAMATSAAPTIFPPFTEIEGERLVDGGLWANNPSLVGLVEAQSVFGVPARNVHVLSIGTTYGIGSRPECLDTGGVLSWVQNARIISALFDAQGSGIAGFIEKLLPEGNHHRVNPPLDQEYPLDSIQPEAMGKAATHEALRLSTLFASKFAPHQPKRQCRLRTP